MSGRESAHPMATQPSTPKHNIHKTSAEQVCKASLLALKLSSHHLAKWLLKIIKWIKPWEKHIFQVALGEISSMWASENSWLVLVTSKWVESGEVIIDYFNVSYLYSLIQEVSKQMGVRSSCAAGHDKGKISSASRDVWNMMRWSSWYNTLDS